MGQDASFVDANASSPATFGKFKAEAALTDAGLSDNADHSTITLYGICEFELDGGELAASSDEGSQAPSTAEDIAGGSIQQSGQPERFHGRCDAADGLHAQRHDFHELFGAGVGIFGNQDAAVIRHLLHSVCEVNVRPGGVIGLVNGVHYGLNDDFTGMKADTDLQTRVSEPRHRVLHGQSSQTASYGMILVRSRRAEKRHDAIALYLVDNAIVAMDGILHEVEHGLQTAHTRFGIS